MKHVISSAGQEPLISGRRSNHQNRKTHYNLNYFNYKTCWCSVHWMEYQLS